MSEDSATLDANLNIRMRRSDLERIERLKERVQQRMGGGVRVSQRTVILEALDALEKRYADLERKR